MFERVKNFFRKGGAKIGMIETLNSILDHPKVAMPTAEYNRIIENRRIYQQQYPDVDYLDLDGRPQKRPYHSINLSKVISRKLAKLIFNEGCKISVDVEEADAFLQDVFSTNKFRKNFSEELEAGYAISGLVLRPYFDIGSGKIKISFCTADSFFPLQSNTSDISEAVISSVTQATEGKKTVYYTLLEFHEWISEMYVISNELYRSEDPDRVGVRVPLTSVEKFRDIVPIARMEGFTRPLFVYVKLAGKNNADLHSPLGAGVIDNAKKQIKDFNDKYDQFMWDIEKSKAKIFASESFFKVRFDARGRPITIFDSNTDVFQKLVGDMDKPFIETFAPPLRSTEYIASMNFILRVIEMQTGLSSGTFSFDGESVKTATEIISENSETYATRSDNVQIIEEAMKELVTTIFELAQAYDAYSGSTNFKITIDFDDGVFISKESQLEYNQKSVVAQIMPKRIAMQRQFGISEKEANAWLAQIQAEMTGLDPTELEQSAYDSTIKNNTGVPGFGDKS